MFSQNGMRQIEKERKILVPNSVHTLLGPENFEKKKHKNSKNLKIPFRLYFQPKRDEIGRKGENKILVPNSVHTRPGKEYSEKNSKKIQKIIKPLPGNIFSQKGMRQAEKKKTKFQSRIPLILDTGNNIPKKIVKKFKKL